ncbi:hypothetical protein RRG08_034732 [Elysia crispata]|uniref:Uncharacterized protein n=1 Tax=Elysia crispata TaxID=231223 RepID=A0AAE1CRH2_9GAST|nr:hypothetical protein RRG08_034732 [Elysia crispata]
MGLMKSVAWQRLNIDTLVMAIKLNEMATIYSVLNEVLFRFKERKASFVNTGYRAADIPGYLMINISSLFGENSC